MAKANPITGGSMFIPAGGEAPPDWTPDTGPRLTGPGGEAAMERYRAAVKAGEQPESGARVNSAEAAPGGAADDAGVVGPGDEASPDRTNDTPREEAEGNVDRDGGSVGFPKSGADGLSMEADGKGDEDRPAGNASRDAWLAYVAEREGKSQDDPTYEGLGRNDLIERADRERR